jgi:hypothetical protein
MELKKLVIEKNFESIQNLLKDINTIKKDFFEFIFLLIEDVLNYSKEYQFELIQIIRVIEIEKTFENENLREKFFKIIKDNIKLKFKYEFKKFDDLKSVIMNLREIITNDLTDCDIYLSNCLPLE